MAETMISSLGEIVEVQVCVSRYATCHTPFVATGKAGKAPGELNWPRGVAIHEEIQQVFLANAWQDRVEEFSETGGFLFQLGVGQLSHPWGIATHGIVSMSAAGVMTLLTSSLRLRCIMLGG